MYSSCSSPRDKPKLLLYRRFLTDPQPAPRWVMTGRKVARADPSWRPFAGPLSPSISRTDGADLESSAG